VASTSEQIETLTGKLGELSRALYAAHDRLEAAEEAWQEKYDGVAETMREEAREDGRKGDPAEHIIVSAARRENRSIYQEWRRAKREVAKLEQISQNRRAELTGYQSVLKGAGERTSGAAGPKRGMTGQAVRRAA
jgi:hypothetical protein